MLNPYDWLVLAIFGTYVLVMAVIVVVSTIRFKRKNKKSKEAE